MTAIVPIGGFRQRMRTQMGLGTQWREDLRPFAGPGVFVHSPVEWHHDPRDILGTLRVVGAKSLIVVCYSWGVGYGAVRLVKEAIKQGFTVELVCSCDGVWRFPKMYVGWLLAVFSMTRLACIKFPAEVRRVVGVHQKNTRPAGHRILHGDEDVQLVRLDSTHLQIDEHPEWRTITSVAIAETLLKE